jgi:hypothetical protein
VSKYQTTVFVCDNPACRNEVHQYRNQESLPNGFHGKPILNVHASGGDSTEDWFACDLACVGPAAREAVDRHFRRLAGFPG